MSECKTPPGGEDLKQAAEDLRRAAESFGDHVIGHEANAHLRQAARHGLQAVRSILDRVEQELTRRDGSSGPGAP